MHYQKINSNCWRVVLLGLVAATSGLMGGSKALADEFPTKPIRLIIPAPPGGGTDGVARLTANAVADSVKWTFVPDNLPGAGGNIGFDQTFKAQKDGYTLAMGESSNMIINQFLYNRIPFSIEKDMQPIALVARVPLVLVVSANGPHKSMGALIDAGKKGSLSFASSGNGTLAHLVGELWKRKAGLDMQHIPYRGAAPAMTDLIGGQVDLFFTSIPVALPMIQGGKVKALAVTAEQRLGLLKDVPTMAEAGFKGMEASVVWGLVGPAGIPAPLVGRINSEVNKALQSPSVIQKLVIMGAERTPGSFGGDADSFARVLREERTKWAPVVKASGATVD
ncbi:MAG: tripartite tricarboxylate transporter substrate binding protein [Hyphomicrobiales bacterium]|nr:MAG: tripartite tricarboxylate transporter substrate binding protein [Hyphomicrobiales bacterium]